jgi:predicted phage tail protein
MKQVILEGFLGEKYGRNWEIRANSYSDILGCIDANYPEFRADLLSLHEAGGDISILTGGELIQDAEDLFYPVAADTIVITPLPAGSKSGGAKLLVAALIIASLFIPGGGAVVAGIAGATGISASVIVLTVAAIGINLAIAGL